MKKKDYYAILGVSRTENTGGIQAAFRRLAKAHHPDVAGGEKTRHFQEIAEAYCTLRDPESRRDYNRSLHRQEQQGNLHVKAQAAVDARPGVFIRPEKASARQDFAPTTSIFEDFFNDFFGTKLFREPSSVADLEVILSPDEAEQGGFLAIPAFEPCPYCGGSGRQSAFPCSHCGAHGRLKSGQSLRVRIPPDIRDGTLLDVPFASHFQRTSSFRVLIRVQEMS